MSLDIRLLHNRQIRYISVRLSKRSKVIQNKIVFVKNCSSGDWIHDLLIWFISVRLSKRSKVTQNKINFVKNFSQWSLNPWPSDHYSNVLPTELGRNLLGRRFLKWAFFVSCTTSHVELLFFSRINRAWLYKGLNVSHKQPNIDLVELTEHLSDDQEIEGSNPNGGNFWWNIFCSM